MRNQSASNSPKLIALSLVASSVTAVACLAELPGDPAGASARLLILAVACCLAAQLFAGQPFDVRWKPLDALWLAAGVTIVFVAGAIADPATRAVGPSIGRLALLLFLFAAFALQLGSIAVSKRTGSNPILFAAFGALFMTPVWLAPAATLVDDPSPVAGAIVAFSPLSAFAAALDFDYLRTPWFYEHSVLGSLRYSYPAWQVYALVFFALSALAVIFGYARVQPAIDKGNNKRTSAP